MTLFVRLSNPSLTFVGNPPGFASLGRSSKLSPTPGISMGDLTAEQDLGSALADISAAPANA